ncbi:hypothetical protein N7509_007707 [Penicillium cosmopolitanum]|uniref:Uncharacterized protein n=1 Tax=Penicillium cosmopolitanum TaxID=1131564 RepID=A0A9W9VZD3_9EURO|nr:uncharacterized protein N7509_007707 [Penicillium cosmopolitanum]KAJ5392217.1 hypothetical protein N7509_007707 [Penicillium cosmopolitanum]
MRQEEAQSIGQAVSDDPKSGDTRTTTIKVSKFGIFENKAINGNILKRLLERIAICKAPRPEVSLIDEFAEDTYKETEEREWNCQDYKFVLVLTTRSKENGIIDPKELPYQTRKKNLNLIRKKERV